MKKLDTVMQLHAMHMITERKPSLLDFELLPGFARYILNKRLDEFVQEQIRLSREINISMLQFFEALPPEEFMALARSGAVEFLTYFAENRAEEQIEAAHRQWLSDTLPIVGQRQIVAEDITQVSYVRKQGFMKLLPDYTTNPHEIVRIISEIDAFMLETETRSTSTYIRLLNTRLEENEAQLRQGIELYKQSQALTHIGNWRWYIGENYVQWSDEMYRVYGLEPQSERITYERFLSMIHPDDREWVNKYVGSALTTGQPLDYIHRVILPDGKVRYLHGKGEVTFSETNQPVEMIGTGQDITERQLATLEIQEKQTFIQKLTDAAPSIIASYNISTGKYVFVNKAVEKLLGYSIEEVMAGGVPFMVPLIHPDDLPKIRLNNRQALERANQVENGKYVDHIEEFRYRMRHRNGEYRWLQTYGTIFDRNPDGSVAHVLNISLDITDKVEAEQKIAEKTVQIEQSNTSLREFAYIASHDLKEPLRKISTFGDRLLEMESHNLSEEGRFVLNKIVVSATRMQTMISDVLAVSLISADKNIGLYNLQAILEEALLTLDDSLGRVIVENAPLPDAQVNASQFRQLFMNLIGNSFKFSRPGIMPEVRIRYRIRSAAEVHSLFPVKSQHVHELSFTDNGIGFDNRFAGRIFAIFQRLHTRKDYEGTGIGLAICRRIMENHGGIIQAQGVVNEGATFTILFPAY